jgi:hypothetical protein
MNMELIKLRASSKDGQVDEEVTLPIDNSEFALLKKYLANCDRLRSAQLLAKEFPCVTNIKWTVEDGLSFEIMDFDYSHVCELLHLARPLFLASEPASFERVQAIFGKKSKGTALAKHLKHLRSVYERGDYQPYFQISVNDTPLFHDNTLKDWLNGVEYHQDQEKEEKIQALESALSENILRGIFVSQLSGRIKAVFMLAHLAKLVVSKKEG